MAEITKQALKVDNNQSFPNNNNGAITPSILRAFNVNMIDSLVDEVGYTADSSSWNQQIDALEQFTASASGLTTGSLLVTASFDNGTRNLTFTKGNNTQFAVNIPDASGSTLPTGVISGSAQITALGFVSSSVTASSIITASVTNDDITFTKGDGTQFTIQVATGSFALSSSFATSASYAATSSYSQFAQDIYLNVKNTTGAQLNKGTVVRIIGATGDNALIATASYEDDNNSANTLGFLYENIPNDSFGKVITQGTLLGINTDPVLGYTAGQILYLSSSGQYTNVKPPAPYHEVRLGQVLRAQSNNGSIYILIQNGYELEELHDVDINTGSLANNNLLAYNTATGQWENKTLTQVGATTTASFNAYTSSTNGRLTNIESTTASLLIETQNLELFSASALTSLSNLNTATASLFTSASLALTTASVSGQTLTFTKGNGTTFNVTLPAGGSGSVVDTGSLVTTASFNAYTSSNDQKVNSLISATGSYATTGSNTFTGNQILSQSLSLVIGNSGSIRSVVNGITAIETTAGFLVSNSTGGELNIEQLAAGTARLRHLNGGAIEISGSQTLIQDVSFIPFSASLNTRINAATINTASFATTASNTFTGDQTFIDAGGNFFTITDTSGSMMLVGKSFTSASAHLSSSILSPSGSLLNLIFKTNNNTADTIISGSNNIFLNPTAPTAGFKRYLSSNNIALAAGFPQISGSMQYSPAINGNYFGAGAITMRGPVSASAQTISGNNILAGVNIGTNATFHAERLTGVLNVTTNNINGGLGVIANQSEIRSNTNITSNNLNGTAFLTLSSSAVAFNNNTINDSGFTFINQFSSGAIGFGAPTIGSNIIGGTSNTFYVTGSQLGAGAAPILNQNLVAGAFNTVFVDASTARISGANIYQNILATSLLGQRLIVTGSSNISDSNSFGSTFVGRWNAVDGVRDKSSDIVFAVGTGTSTTRKTGFHITSGSNSFFEGTVSISGSLLVNGIAPAAVDTGSFATTGSNAFNGNQTISGSVSIRGNTTFTSFSGDQSSVILGSEALGASSGGSINVAIGNQAMKFASGSNQNVAIGNRALFKATGSFNIAIGSETLTENTTGNNNVAIGLNALNLATTSAENFALGTNSMQFTSASMASFNIGIGANTLSKNQTDSQTAIGSNALQNVTTGNANTAIGRLALNATTTGFDNTSIGVNSLLSNTTGYRNTAIGKESMRRNISGHSNLAIGYSALYENLTGTNNVAIGNNALLNMSASNSQTAIGNNALAAMTNGGLNNGQNMVFGVDAMSSVITASVNTVIGPGALRDPRSAEENVVIGWLSGINASGSVNYNTLIGARAAQKVSADGNTIIGHGAATQLVIGANNVFLGKSVGDNIITGSANTLIGQGLTGQNNWNNVIALADGGANIKFFNSGSRTTLTNDTLISGSLTTTGSANIGTVMTLTPLDPLPAGTIGMLAVSSSNQLFFYNGAWTQIS